MVKNNAVLVTVAFALFVTISSISYVFYALYQINRERHYDTIFAKHDLISQIYHTYLQQQVSDPMFQANLALYNLDDIRNEEEYILITKNGTVLKNSTNTPQESEGFLLKDPLEITSASQPVIVSMIEYQNKIYFWVESLKHPILLADNDAQPYNPITLLSSFGTVLLVVLIAFSLIIHRLNPLRRLRRQIARFGEGKLDISFKMKGSDEISLIANELDTTQKKIRELIESRTLFLRNIMHELKTPIAKGRIASTMLTDEKQQTRFIGIFERLESLIGEFALIEEITSGHQNLEKSEYRLIDIIDGAIDRAMVDYEAVEAHIDATIKLNVDYRFFVTAVKNMIDNAIKYSPDGKMIIRMENEEICFVNRGEELTKPLSYYIEAFHKEHVAKDSFGLGLYIVDAILKEHDYVLAYERWGDENCFIFVPDGKMKENG